MIVHQMTALSDIKMGKIDSQFEVTNRLRTEGTRNLIAAAPGTKLITTSFAGWPYARTGGPIKTETRPARPRRRRRASARPTPRSARSSSSPIEAGGIVLRYGGFYGPGTGMAPDGEQAEDDQASASSRSSAAARASGRCCTSRTSPPPRWPRSSTGGPGEIYNVVDDEPAAVKEWLPYLAEQLGAKPPRKVPAFLARLIGGPAAVMMMTESRGASNEKAKQELDWAPKHSWRELRDPVAN